MKVAVVILNYNGEKLLPRFLPSVIQHTVGAQLIVADNGSTDQSLELLRHFPEVTVIALDKNYGFCGGYNRALRQLDAQYFVLLNSDVEVTPGWIAPLLDTLEQDNSIIAVQPKIMAYHQRDHFEYAGAAGGFLDWLGYPFCRGRLFNFTEKDEGQYNDVREIFWASGACLMIRAKAYHDLGGLDEDFFAHMEEIDLCWRIQRAGGKVYYVGSSHVYHMGAGTLAKSNPRKTYLNFRNSLWLLYKNLSPVALLIKLPLRVLLDYLAVAKLLVGGHWNEARAILSAHIDFLKSWGDTRAKRRAIRSKLPYTTQHIYPGLIIWNHFILRRNKITVD